MSPSLCIGGSIRERIVQDAKMQRLLVIKHLPEVISCRSKALYVLDRGAVAEAKGSARQLPPWISLTERHLGVFL